MDQPGDERERGAGGWLAFFLKRAGPGMGAAYTIVGGVLGLGLAGFVLDRWLGTSPAFVLVGIGLGLVVGFYELAKVVFGGGG